MQNEDCVPHFLIDLSTLHFNYAEAIGKNLEVTIWEHSKSNEGEGNLTWNVEYVSHSLDTA